MTDNPLFDNNRDGFRIGEYFVTFPPGDFVKEDSKGMYIMVDVYKIEKDNRAVKVNTALTPGLEQMINDELNKMLSRALETEKENVKDQSS
jgi:hypothetical protein